MTHIAMDVHKQRSVLACQSPAQTEPKIVRCYTTQTSIAQVLSELPRPWIVCLEATRQSPAVVTWLRELGVDAIQLVDPKGLKAFLKGKPKSDARDAKEMLALLQMGRLPKAYLAPSEVQEVRALTRARAFVRRGSTSWRNQLRALLNQHGLEVPARDLCGISGQRQLAESTAHLGPHGQVAAQELTALLVATEAALDVLDGQIRAELAREPVARALMALPGIGPVMALGLVAELGEIERFEDPAHLISYAGLAPRANDSDEHHGPRHLPFRCNKRLRHLAIQAAQAACRSRQPSNARRTYERLRARGLHHNTAKIAAARDLLKDIFYGWKGAQAQTQPAA
jgi:transposase